MITLPEAKDIEKLFFKLEELNDRTKRHTKQIKELERKLKKEWGIKNDERRRTLNDDNHKK